MVTKRTLSKGVATTLALFVSTAAMASSRDEARVAREAHKASHQTATQAGSDVVRQQVPPGDSVVRRPAPMTAEQIKATLESAKGRFAQVNSRLSPKLASLVGTPVSSLSATGPQRLQSVDRRLLRRIENGNRNLQMAQAQLAAAKRSHDLLRAYQTARRAERDFVKANTILTREEVRR